MIAETLILQANTINDFINDRLIYKTGEQTYITLKISNGFINKTEKI